LGLIYDLLLSTSLNTESTVS